MCTGDIQFTEGEDWDAKHGDLPRLRKFAGPQDTAIVFQSKFD
jgi:hypothetical protein